MTGIFGILKMERLCMYMDDFDVFNYECDGQLSFTFNGNIAPCPYIRDCNTYGIGCQGTSYWCKRFDTKTNRKNEEE